MSCSKWAYIPSRCDGEPCPGDCDCCSKTEDNVQKWRKNMTNDEAIRNIEPLLATEFPCRREALRMAISALERDRWISVEERLPEVDGWYLVYAPTYSGGSSSGLKNIGGNMFAKWNRGHWSIEVGYHKRPGCVTHWMPLPEPPKEET